MTRSVRKESDRELDSWSHNDYEDFDFSKTNNKKLKKKKARSK